MFKPGFSQASFAMIHLLIFKLLNTLSLLWLPIIISQFSIKFAFVKSVSYYSNIYYTFNLTIGKVLICYSLLYWKQWSGLSLLEPCLLILFKAKAEETKLLSQRVESQEESDLDDEPKENQQLNKHSKMKDKVERLVRLQCAF